MSRLVQIEVPWFYIAEVFARETQCNLREKTQRGFGGEREFTTLPQNKVCWVQGRQFALHIVEVFLFIVFFFLLFLFCSGYSWHCTFWVWHCTLLCSSFLYTTRNKMSFSTWVCAPTLPPEIKHPQCETDPLFVLFSRAGTRRNLSTLIWTVT